MFNILGILGISAIVYPFSVLNGGVVFSLDLPIAVEAMQYAGALVTWTDIGAIILSVFLLGLFAFTGKRIARWEGAILLAGYALYMGLRFELIPTFGLGL